MRSVLKRAQISIWALLLVLNTILVPATAQAEASNEDARGIQLRLSSSADTVLTGQTLVYTIDYSLSSTTENFTGATIELPLPKGVVFEQAKNSEHVVSKHEQVGDIDVVTFTFKDPTESGVTGRLQVTAHYLNDITPDGTKGSTAAIFKQENGSLKVESNTVTVTGNASAEWKLEKSRVVPVEGVKPQPGTNVVYKITLQDAKNPADNYGNLHIDQVVITDILPAEAVFKEAVPAPSSISGQTLTWNIDAKDLNKDKISERSKSILVTVTYPKENVVLANGKTKEVINKAEASYQPLGSEETVSLEDDTKHAFIEEPSGGIWMYKQMWNGEEKELSQGQEASFYIGGLSNAANVQLDDVVVTDMTPKGLTLRSIKIPSFSGTDIQSYNLEYTSTDTPNGDADWKLWKTLPFSTGTQVQAAEISEPIKGVRLVLGDVPVDFSQHAALELRYRLDSYEAVKDDDYVYGKFPKLEEKYPDEKFESLDERNGLPTNEEVITIAKPWKQTINYAALHYELAGNKHDRLTGVKVLVVQDRPLLEVDKRVVSGSTTSPGGTVTYKLDVSNSGLTNVPFQNPIVTDWLPKDLEFAPESVTVRLSNGEKAPAPVFTKEDTEGKTQLIWSWGTDSSNQLTLQPKETLSITFEAKVLPNAKTGKITNEVEVTSKDHQYLNGLTNFKNQRYKEGKWYVYNNADIYVNGMDSLVSEKWVQGDLDNGQWSRYPDTGNVTPGGEIQYKLAVTNKGSIGMKDIVIVDVLPRGGDKGVIDPSPRGSKWSPILTAPITTPSGVSVSYSTDEHVTMTEGNWTSEPPQDITRVRALKFAFTSDVVLSPGQSKELIWTMRAPVGTPTGDDQIAWNSFGYTATSVISNVPMLPAEPLKVGIKVKENPKAELGDYVWFDQNRNGIQDEDVEHGINGVRVDLYRASDSKLLQSTVTGDSHDGKPGYYLFSGLDADEYYVRFHLPGEYDGFTPQNVITDPAKNSKPNAEGRTGVIALREGEKHHDVDAGVIKQDTPPILGKGAIGKYVWLDTNGDGIQDGHEAGLNGVVVELYNQHNEKLATTVTHSVYYSSVTNSVYDPTVTGSVYDPTVTDYVYKPGYYVFEQLDTGTYKVRFIAPEGYTFTKAYQGGNLVLDSNADANGWSESIALTSEALRNLTLDTGFIVRMGPGPDPEPVKGSIGKFVWIDKNGNGVQDDGEEGLNGITVELYDAYGNLLKSTLTKPMYYHTATNKVYDHQVEGTEYRSGYYLFDQLDSNHYRIKFVLSNEQKQKYDFTKRNQGVDRVLDSDADLDGWSAAIALAEGQHLLMIDAGVVEKASPPGPGPGPNPGTEGPGPGGPGGPVDPGKPTEPDEPTDPDGGTNPEQPGQPTDPDDDEQQPGDDTAPDQDQGSDGGNPDDEAVDGDANVGGETDEEQPSAQPDGMLPQTGEKPSIAPIVGFFFMAAALVLWIIRRRVLSGSKEM